jgi:hypothetical protein
MSDIIIHVNQIITREPGGKLELTADGDRGMVYIEIESSSSGRFWVAKSAKEYWIEGEDKELEESIPLPEAIKFATNCVPTTAYHVDDHFTVAKEIKKGTYDFRILVWRDEGADPSGRMNAVKIERKK